MLLQQIKLAPTYKKPNGLWVLKIDIEVVSSHFDVKEQSIVYIPPLQRGGNHKHPRSEAFIAVGDLYISWVEDGEIMTTHMYKDDQLSLIIVPPNIPHVVENRSDTTFGVLYEFADDVQHSVEQVSVI